MIALITVIFLSAAAGAAWLMLGSRQAEIQPEAITPFESGSTGLQSVEAPETATEIEQPESEKPLPDVTPVEKKRTGSAPVVESIPASPAPSPVKAGDYPSSTSSGESTAMEPQKHKRRTADAPAEASGPKTSSGGEPATTPPEQDPAHAARMPVTNTIDGSGPEKKELPANGSEGPETGPETPQP